MLVDVKLFDDLDAAADDAGDALDRARQPRLFDRIAWFRLLLRHVAQSRIVVARAHREGSRAWLFLADRGGGRAEALGCWYTLGFAPIYADAPAPLDRELLLTALAKALKRRFWWIALAPLRDADRAELDAGFATAGWGTLASAATINRQVAIGSDFDSWWATRPGRLRNTVRRKAKASAFQIEIADRFDPALWDAYEAVYAKSWKDTEGSAPMLRALVEAEGAAGTLRLGIASLDGVPVAAQFWLVEAGVATIHKLAYDEAAKPLSPGTVLSAAMFRHVIDGDKPRLIDFGTGDDPYKAEWMDDRHTLWRLDLFRLSDPRGLARYARARLAALVRARKGG